MSPKPIFTLFFIQFFLAQANTTNDREPIHASSPSILVTFSIISLICVLFGGLMSGLTVGLMGIDELELELKLSNGTQEEKQASKRILGVISQHHLLLVTLLLSNALAMESLPLFLDEIFNTELSLIISVTFVLLFGEVIPQALCTGKDQLKIANKMVPFVKCLMILLLPISYPIAKLLDYIMEHKESSVKMKRNDLKTFIGLHENLIDDGMGEGGLDRLQISLMHGVIDLNVLKSAGLMEPLDGFVCIAIDLPLNSDIIDEIVKNKYDLVAFYKDYRDNIVAFCHTSELFKVWEGDIIEKSDIVLKDPVVIHPRETILFTLKQLEANQSDLAFIVTDDEGIKHVVGVVTKEMILDHILINTNLTEREEIAEISHAIAGHPDKPKVYKKDTSMLRRNLV